jgi:shikimate kinase
MARATGHVLLIGLRASGKSTLGAALAKATDRRFIDLDDATPTLLGRSSVADVFEMDGEAPFRDAESRALGHALAAAGSVVALGGGTPTAPGAAALINKARRDDGARVIYLRAEPSTLRSRLQSADNAHRPSITGAGTLEEIDVLFADRDALYRSIADAVISTDDLTPDETLSLLVAASEQDDANP